MGSDGNYNVRRTLRETQKIAKRVRQRSQKESKVFVAFVQAVNPKFDHEHIARIVHGSDAEVIGRYTHKEGDVYEIRGQRYALDGLEDCILGVAQEYGSMPLIMLRRLPDGATLKTEPA